MVDVTDGADVDVRLVALELLLRHWLSLLSDSQAGKHTLLRRQRALPSGARRCRRRCCPGPVEPEQD
jgi:hypothetical protein